MRRSAGTTVSCRDMILFFDTVLRSTFVTVENTITLRTPTGEFRGSAARASLTGDPQSSSKNAEFLPATVSCRSICLMLDDTLQSR